MGYTLGPDGEPDYNDDASNPVDDFQAAKIWAAKIGGTLRGTSTERQALTASQVRVGWLFVETDTGTIWQYAVSGWVLVWHDWKTYTPTTTNISGGTIAAKYKRDGNVVRVQLRHTLAGANFTGQPSYSLPVPAADTSVEWFDGVVLLRDGSPVTEYFGIARKATQTTVAPYALAASTPFTQFSNVDDDSPFLWAAGDIVDMKFTYEV